MFGGVAQTAPPQNRAIFDDVIQPIPTDLFGGNFGRVARRGCIVVERADKSESAGNIVIGDDERGTDFLVNVAVDVAERSFDFFVGPLLEWASQINADDFARNSRINAHRMIVGQSGKIH